MSEYHNDNIQKSHISRNESNVIASISGLGSKEDSELESEDETTSEEDVEEKNFLRLLNQEFKNEVQKNILADILAHTNSDKTQLQNLYLKLFKRYARYASPNYELFAYYYANNLNTRSYSRALHGINGYRMSLVKWMKDKINKWTKSNSNIIKNNKVLIEVGTKIKNHIEVDKQYMDAIIAGLERIERIEEYNDKWIRLADAVQFVVPIDKSFGNNHADEFINNPIFLTYKKIQQHCQSDEMYDKYYDDWNKYCQETSLKEKSQNPELFLQWLNSKIINNEFSTVVGLEELTQLQTLLETKQAAILEEVEFSMQNILIYTPGSDFFDTPDDISIETETPVAKPAMKSTMTKKSVVESTLVKN